MLRWSARVVMQTWYPGSSPLLTVVVLAQTDSNRPARNNYMCRFFYYL